MQGGLRIGGSDAGVAIREKPKAFHIIGLEDKRPVVRRAEKRVEKAARHTAVAAEKPRGSIEGTTCKQISGETSGSDFAVGDALIGDACGSDRPILDRIGFQGGGDGRERLTGGERRPAVDAEVEVERGFGKIGKR